MVARRAVLQGAVGAIAGGNPVMRPDQALQPISRAGTGPAPQTGPLVNPVIIITPGRAVLFYSPAPGLGNLVGSIAGSSGTDSFGNAYVQGNVVYSNNGTTWWAFEMTTTAGNPGFLQWVQSTGPGGPFTGLGSIAMGSTGILNLNPSTSLDVNAPMAVTAGGASVIGGTKTDTLDATTSALVGGTVAATATQLEVQGTLGVKNEAAPAAVTGYAEPFASGGNLAYVNGLAGDGQTYDTGTFHLVTSPAFSVTATAFPNPVTGASVAVGIGHYRYRCVVNATGTVAAGTPQLEFTFPSLSGTFMQTYATATGVATVQFNQATVSAVTSVALAVGPILNAHGFQCIWEGDFTTTAAGTLQLGAITSNAADTYTVANVWLDLYPVN